MSMRLLRQERWARWDALLLSLALIHGIGVITWPSIPLIAIGLWWNANTISHNFIHRPFFRVRALNAVFSCYLSLLFGFPHSLWRARHLAHHGVRTRADLKVAPLDVAVTILVWGGLFTSSPSFALAVYAPGFILGLALCYLQGYFEHVRGPISHYGFVYNSLFLNDGYHFEHHIHPGRHWRELPRQKAPDANASRWPAVLRWLECVNLCALERLVLRFPALQRFVLHRHERAFRKLLNSVRSIDRVGIVGGGLFPRTAIILRRIMPDSTLTLIDMCADNIAIARRFVSDNIQCAVERFEPSSPTDFDLLVIPLAFVGDRSSIYKAPPARLVLVHDWIWRRRGSSVIVSWFLLKRLNLVQH